MASKSEQKRLDAQLGTEVEQLAEAAEEAALKEARQGADLTQGIGAQTNENARDGDAGQETKEYSPIVRKQANRLLRLFQLQPGHEGRAERIAEYQAALARNGVEVPPANEAANRELIREVGEYNG